MMLSVSNVPQEDGQSVEQACISGVLMVRWHCPFASKGFYTTHQLMTNHNATVFTWTLARAEQEQSESICTVLCTSFNEVVLFTSANIQCSVDAAAASVYKLCVASCFCHSLTAATGSVCFLFLLTWHQLVSSVAICVSVIKDQGFLNFYFSDLKTHTNTKGRR